jgi:hypothetical protein
MKNKMNKLNAALLACIMLFSSAASNAKDGNAKDAFDGSSNLICVTVDVVACMDALDCARGEARTFDLPEFMTVDFNKKAIQVTYDEGTQEAVSPIKHIEVTGSQLVIQGLEANHGWTMAIHRTNGRMSLAAVGEELSYTMFGACKAL